MFTATGGIKQPKSEQNSRATLQGAATILAATSRIASATVDLTAYPVSSSAAASARFNNSSSNNSDVIIVTSDKQQQPSPNTQSGVVCGGW